MIRTILHGGLGNQLYQLFYTELLAEALGTEMTLVSTCLSQYAVGREMELAPLLNGSASISMSDDINVVERLRLPKVIARAAGVEIPIRWRPRQAIVDGYFQAPTAYRRFDPVSVAALLGKWRARLKELALIRSPALPHLTHVRLTDFVREGHDPRELATPKVTVMPDGGRIMTDDEANVLTVLELAFGPGGADVLLTTDGLSSWDVFAAMSEFQVIDTNGSSLACWAAILSGAQLYSSNADHAQFARFCAAAERRRGV